MNRMREIMSLLASAIQLSLLLTTSASFAPYNIETIAGNGLFLTSGDEGYATNSGLNNPVAIWENSVGTVYIVEKGSHCVRVFSTLDNIIRTFAGVCGSFGFSGDGGKASSAIFNGPSGVNGNTNGDVYITGKSNNRVRVVTSGDLVSTFAGTGSPVTSGDGGQATSAGVNSPLGLWVNSLGYLFIVQNSDAVVRSIDTSGIVTTIAGKILQAFVSLI